MACTPVEFTHVGRERWELIKAAVQAVKHAGRSGADEVRRRNRPLKLLLVIAATAALSAQVDLSRPACGGDASKPRLMAYVPSTITLGTRTVTVPVQVCLQLGAGVTVNMAAAGGPSIEAAAPPAVLPRMYSERVALDPATMDIQVSMLRTLARTPAAGTLVLAFLKSSQFGLDTMDASAPDATAPKTISITLPKYRPFTTADSVLLIYWSVE